MPVAGPDASAAPPLHPSMLDRWLPPELRDAPSTRIRASVGVTFPLIYIAFATLGTLGYVATGAWWTAACMAATLPIMAAAPWLLVRTRSLEWCAHVSAAVFFTLILATSVVQGGTDWRALAYAGPALLYTLLVGGARPATTWLVVALAGILGLFGLSAAGFPFPAPAVETSAGIDMMELLILTVSIYTVAMVHARVNAAVVSQLDHTSAALARIRAGLDDAQRMARVGSWEYDPRTDRAQWSETLHALFLLPPAPPRTIAEILSHVHPDDVAVVTEMIARTDGRGEADVRIVRTDGEERVLHCLFSVVTDDHGRRIAVAGTAQDVTEARRAQEELVRAREQALCASEAKSQFLSHMSHEIRTPMNGVVGMISLALGTRLDDEQREYVEGARTAGLNLLTIINDILDLTKVEAGELTTERIPFSLPEILGEVVDTLAHGARRRGLDVRLEVDPGLAPLHGGDPVRIRQILFNLVGNAVKFTQAGAVTIRAGGAAGAVRIVVEDTGPGIPAEALGRIFESFQQADASTTRRYGGTGLGLTISRKLTDLLGGRLWVESELGVGSRFHLELPLPAVEAPAPAVPPEGGPPEGGPPEGGSPEGGPPDSIDAPPPRRLVVLLAEDSAVNSLVASRLLGRFGHDVIRVDNGRDAVRAALAEPIDVVLMDVQMPELDGLEATRLIRRHEATHGGHLPIVALTANAMKGDDETCLAAGMDAYLTKPLDPRRLEAAVRANAARKRGPDA